MPEVLLLTLQCRGIYYFNLVVCTGSALTVCHYSNLKPFVCKWTIHLSGHTSELWM